MTGEPIGACVQNVLHSMAFPNCQNGIRTLRIFRYIVLLFLKKILTWYTYVLRYLEMLTNVGTNHAFVVFPLVWRDLNTASSVPRLTSRKCTKCNH